MDHKKNRFWAKVSWPLTYRKGWIIGNREGETLNHTLHVCIQHSIYEQVKFPEARADRFHQILKGGLDKKKYENHQFRRTQKSDCKNLYSINYFTPNEQIKILAGLTSPSLPFMNDVSDIYSLSTMLLFGSSELLKLLTIIIMQGTLLIC